jgi:hypothetical protein
LQREVESGIRRQAGYFVEEEADESAFWMEIIIEAGLMERRLVQPLLDEAEELVAIMVASRKSVNRKSAI